MIGFPETRSLYRFGVAIPLLCALIMCAGAPRAQAAVGEVSTYAGSGVKGELDGPATTAQFYFPSDVEVDPAGNLYVLSNQAVRKIAVDGTVSTLAGRNAYGFADGPGATALFYQPSDLALDRAGNVYVADSANKRIRKISPAGQVTTFAGSGQNGSLDGPAATATFGAPTALAVDSSGTVYVADYSENRVRKITTDGVVSTVAGSGVRGFLDGPSATAQLGGLRGIAVDSSGSIFVADADNRRIRKISAGTVSTFAGSGAVFRGNGNGTAASFVWLGKLSIDQSNTMYMPDLNTVVSVSRAGLVKTVAGSPTGAFGSANGPAASSSFSGPSSVAIDGFGSLFVADSGNSLIRKIAGDPNFAIRAINLPGPKLTPIFGSTTATTKKLPIQIRKRT